MINYSIIFTNDFKDLDIEIDKYICFDNKIHIRLKDFNKEELIIGFEKKLTYLLSYLINYSYIPKLVGNYTDKDVLRSFLLDETVAKIIAFIGSCIEDKSVAYEGILLKPNYKKDKKALKYFGDTDIRFFPLEIKNNVMEAGSLDFFLQAFNIDLYSYLFDDAYAIWLHEKELKPTKKFDSRKLRKLNRQNNRNIDIAELW